MEPSASLCFSAVESGVSPLIYICRRSNRFGADHPDQVAGQQKCPGSVLDKLVYDHGKLSEVRIDTHPDIVTVRL